MKIWVIGREYPMKQNNMRGSFEMEQAKILAKRHTVIYPSVDLRSIRRWRKWGMEKFTEDHVLVCKYNFPVGKMPEFVLESIGEAVKKRLYKKIVQETGLPDMIHIHYPSMIGFGLFEEFKRHGVKIVATEHWTKVLQKDLNRHSLDALCQFTDQADAFICVGNPLRESVISLTGTKRKIEVVPNVVSPLFFRDEHCQNMNKEKFVFISTGRLVKVKQFDMVIRAFSSVFAGKKNVLLHIIGGGEEAAALEKLIAELKMNDQIKLLGVMTRSGVAEQLRKSDALVCASRLETFGVPVIEAMACGKPSIGTDALGFLENFHETCGIIVPWNDEKALGKAMEKMYENYDFYDAGEIASYALSQFGENAICSRLENIYEECM